MVYTKVYTTLQNRPAVRLPSVDDFCSNFLKKIENREGVENMYIDDQFTYPAFFGFTSTLQPSHQSE